MHVLLFVFLLLQQPDPLAEDIDKAIANLYSDKHAESDVAKQELIEIGRKAVGRLVAELGRQRVPEGSTDDEKKRKQIRVRRLICEVLGRIRDNSQAVLDALAARLTDTDEYGLTVAAAAAGALDLIADEHTAGPLVTALTSKQADTDKWLKYYCIHALGVMRAAQAADALKKALEDTGAAQVASEDYHLIAAAAADALGRIRAKDAADGLGKLLANERKNPFTDQTVAVHAARALERVLGESKGSLTGEQTTIDASLKTWRAWWDGEQAKKNAALTRQIIKEVADAVEAYKRDQEAYPATLAYLRDKPPTGLKKPYPEGGYYKGDKFKAGEIRDAWDRPLRYDNRSENGAPYDIVSYGRDGRSWGKGDDADIWNHEGWKAVKVEKTRKALAEIVAALTKCKEDQNWFPDKLDHLVGSKPPPGFTPQKEWPKEGYLKEIPRDGFDNQFNYQRGGKGGEAYDLMSHGADRGPGGLDENADIWNHDKWKQSAVEDTKRKMDALVKALELFKKEQERWPAELVHLRDKPPYAKKDKWPSQPIIGYHTDPVNDFFGNPFVYRCPASTGEQYELGSLGGDGREGGTGPDADIWLKGPK